MRDETSWTQVFGLKLRHYSKGLSSSCSSFSTFISRFLTMTISIYTSSLIPSSSTMLFSLCLHMLRFYITLLFLATSSLPSLSPSPSSSSPCYVFWNITLLCHLLCLILLHCLVFLLYTFLLSQSASLHPLFSFSASTQHTHLY